MVEAIRNAGLPVTTAVKIAGISRATHYRWMREDPAYRLRVEQASGQRSGRLVRNIIDKGSTDWRSDAWLLERTDADFRERKELSVHVEQAVEQLLNALEGEMSEEAYGELVAGIARLQGLDAGEATEVAEAGSTVPRLPAPAGGDRE